VKKIGNMTLVFASANKNKVKEINDILSARTGSKTIEVVSMADIGCLDDIPETTGTIKGNAIQKATFLWYKYRVNCFSEDTGLEIEALNGEPGVDTAHYSGTRDADANIAKVLARLKENEQRSVTEQRSAQFKTIIALILDGELHVFEGICKGSIRHKKSSGTEGFGYDPIFQPDGYDKTFAELGSAVKSQISHRGRAMKKLLAFVTT
jgi:XTP/dITP diphosphohydrolase